MMNRNSKTEKGFTVIEMLVVIVLFSILLYGMTMLVSGMFNGSLFQRRLLDNNDQGRKVASNFANEIRNATRSVNGAYPLEIVSAQQIAFYTLSNGTIIRVRY